MQKANLMLIGTKNQVIKLWELNAYFKVGVGVDSYLVYICIKTRKLCQDKVYLFQNQMMNG